MMMQENKLTSRKVYNYLKYLLYIKNIFLGLSQVRMAERSKAPDSRFTLLTDNERAFWSSYEGVGSNPTSDKIFLIFIKKYDLGYLIALNSRKLELK